MLGHVISLFEGTHCDEQPDCFPSPEDIKWPDESTMSLTVECFSRFTMINYLLSRQYPYRPLTKILSPQPSLCYPHLCSNCFGGDHYFIEYPTTPIIISKASEKLQTTIAVERPSVTSWVVLPAGPAKVYSLQNSTSYHVFVADEETFLSASDISRVEVTVFEQDSATEKSKNLPQFVEPLTDIFVSHKYDLYHLQGETWISRTSFPYKLQFSVPSYITPAGQATILHCLFVCINDSKFLFSPTHCLYTSTIEVNNLIIQVRPDSHPDESTERSLFLMPFIIQIALKDTESNSATTNLSSNIKKKVECVDLFSCSKEIEGNGLRLAVELAAYSFDVPDTLPDNKSEKYTCIKALLADMKEKILSRLESTGSAVTSMMDRTNGILKACIAERCVIVAHRFLDRVSFYSGGYNCDINMDRLWGSISEYLVAENIEDLDKYLIPENKNLGHLKAYLHHVFQHCLTAEHINCSSKTGEAELLPQGNITFVTVAVLVVAYHLNHHSSLLQLANEFSKWQRGSGCLLEFNMSDTHRKTRSELYGLPNEMLQAIASIFSACGFDKEHDYPINMFDDICLSNSDSDDANDYKDNIERLAPTQQMLASNADTVASESILSIAKFLLSLPKFVILSNTQNYDESADSVTVLCHDVMNILKGCSVPHISIQQRFIEAAALYVYLVQQEAFLLLSLSGDDSMRSLLLATDDFPKKRLINALLSAGLCSCDSIRQRYLDVFSKLTNSTTPSNQSNLQKPFSEGEGPQTLSIHHITNPPRSALAFGVFHALKHCLPETVSLHTSENTVHMMEILLQWLQIVLNDSPPNSDLSWLPLHIPCRDALIMSFVHCIIVCSRSTSERASNLVNQSIISTLHLLYLFGTVKIAAPVLATVASIGILNPCLNHCMQSEEFVRAMLQILWTNPLSHVNKLAMYTLSKAIRSANLKKQHELLAILFSNLGRGISRYHPSVDRASTALSKLLLSFLTVDAVLKPTTELATSENCNPSLSSELSFQETIVHRIETGTRILQEQSLNMREEHVIDSKKTELLPQRSARNWMIDEPCYLRFPTALAYASDNNSLPFLSEATGSDFIHEFNASYVYDFDHDLVTFWNEHKRGVMVHFDTSNGSVLGSIYQTEINSIVLLAKEVSGSKRFVAVTRDGLPPKSWSTIACTQVLNELNHQKGDFFDEIMTPTKSAEQHGDSSLSDLDFSLAAFWVITANVLPTSSSNVACPTQLPPAVQHAVLKSIPYIFSFSQHKQLLECNYPLFGLHVLALEQCLYMLQQEDVEFYFKQAGVTHEEVLQSLYMISKSTLHLKPNILHAWLGRDMFKLSFEKPQSYLHECLQIALNQVDESHSCTLCHAQQPLLCNVDRQSLGKALKGLYFEQLCTSNKQCCDGTDQDIVVLENLMATTGSYFHILASRETCEWEIKLDDIFSGAFDTALSFDDIVTADENTSKSSLSYCCNDSMATNINQQSTCHGNTLPPKTDFVRAILGPNIMPLHLCAVCYFTMFSFTPKSAKIDDYLREAFPKMSNLLEHHMYRSPVPIGTQMINVFDGTTGVVEVCDSRSITVKKTNGSTLMYSLHHCGFIPWFPSPICLDRSSPSVLEKYITPPWHAFAEWKLCHLSFLGREDNKHLNLSYLDYSLHNQACTRSYVCGSRNSCPGNDEGTSSTCHHVSLNQMLDSKRGNNADESVSLHSMADTLGLYDCANQSNVKNTVPDANFPSATARSKRPSSETASCLSSHSDSTSSSRSSKEHRAGFRTYPSSQRQAEPQAHKTLIQNNMTGVRVVYFQMINASKTDIISVQLEIEHDDGTVELLDHAAYSCRNIKFFKPFLGSYSKKKSRVLCIFVPHNFRLFRALLKVKKLPELIRLAASRHVAHPPHVSTVIFPHSQELSDIVLFDKRHPWIPAPTQALRLRDTDDLLCIHRSAKNLVGWNMDYFGRVSSTAQSIFVSDDITEMNRKDAYRIVSQNAAIRLSRMIIGLCLVRIPSLLEQAVFSTNDTTYSSDSILSQRLHYLSLACADQTFARPTKEELVDSLIASIVSSTQESVKRMELLVKQYVVPTLSWYLLPPPCEVKPSFRLESFSSSIEHDNDVIVEHFFDQEPLHGVIYIPGAAALKVFVSFQSSKRQPSNCLTFCGQDGTKRIFQTSAAAWASFTFLGDTITYTSDQKSQAVAWISAASIRHVLSWQYAESGHYEWTRDMPTALRCSITEAATAKLFCSRSFLLHDQLHLDVVHLLMPYITSSVERLDLPIALELLDTTARWALHPTLSGPGAYAPLDFLLELSRVVKSNRWTYETLFDYCTKYHRSYVREQQISSMECICLKRDGKLFDIVHCEHAGQYASSKQAHMMEKSSYGDGKIANSHPVDCQSNSDSDYDDSEIEDDSGNNCYATLQESRMSASIGEIFLHIKQRDVPSSETIVVRFPAAGYTMINNIQATYDFAKDHEKVLNGTFLQKKSPTSSISCFSEEQRDQDMQEYYFPFELIDFVESIPDFCAFMSSLPWLLHCQEQLEHLEVRRAFSCSERFYRLQELGLIFGVEDLHEWQQLCGHATVVALENRSSFHDFLSELKSSATAGFVQANRNTVECGYYTKLNRLSKGFVCKV